MKSMCMEQLELKVHESVEASVSVYFIVSAFSMYFQRVFARKRGDFLDPSAANIERFSCLL